MKMGNKNFIQLARMISGTQQLVLRAFTAVKQPQTAAGGVMKIQQDRRHVS